MELHDIESRLELQIALVSHCSILNKDILELRNKRAANNSNQSDNIIISFVRRLEIYFIGVLVIEILKLFNPNEKYSIRKLLNKMNDAYNNSSWKSLISKTEIENFLSVIDSDNTKDKIERLKKFRNREIAHLDTKIFDDVITFDDMDYLINLGEATLNRILQPLFATDMTTGFNKEDSHVHLYETSFETFWNTINKN